MRISENQIRRIIRNVLLEGPEMVADDSTSFSSMYWRSKGDTERADRMDKDQEALNRAMVFTKEGSATVAEIIAGFYPPTAIPIDAKDLSIALSEVYVSGGDEGKMNTSFAVIGFIPILGDILKKLYKFLRKIPANQIEEVADNISKQSIKRTKTQKFDSPEYTGDRHKTYGKGAPSRSSRPSKAAVNQLSNVIDNINLRSVRLSDVPDDLAKRLQTKNIDPVDGKYGDFKIIGIGQRPDGGNGFRLYHVGSGPMAKNIIPAQELIVSSNTTAKIMTQPGIGNDATLLALYAADDVGKNALQALIK
jgi:hypothetical protein